MKQLNRLLLKIFVYTIAILFSAESLVAADFSSTLDLANKGDSVAIGEIAVMYCTGEGVQKNYKEALKWAEKGTSLDNSDAMYVMGYLYQHGGAVDRDTKKAYDWYYKAAEQGSAAAMCEIGLIQLDARKYGEAEKWFVRASDFNYARANENLSDLRSMGYAVSGHLQFKDKFDEEFDRTLAKNLAQKQRGKKINSNISMFDSVGFDVSDKTKSNEGYLVISKVKSGSVAEKLGLLIGSDLYQIDNMNTKQFSAKEIRSYINKQREIGATVLVIFMAEDGTPKRADIKLK